MSLRTCIYCRGCVWGDKQESTRVCDTCREQIKKFDEDTINWLMTVIDGRIYAELDNHTDRYSHESSDRGYY
jgi:hypothetical protein